MSQDLRAIYTKPDFIRRSNYEVKDYFGPERKGPLSVESPVQTKSWTVAQQLFVVYERQRFGFVLEKVFTSFANNPLFFHTTNKNSLHIWIHRVIFNTLYK